MPGYAELHCLTAFSFQRGASEPSELVERAVKLGYQALAITDECSLAGVVRAHKQLREMRETAHHELLEAARNVGLADLAIPQPPLLKLLIGSEFLVRDNTGRPRFKLVLLAQNLNGYGNLSQFITQLRRASPVKGEYTLHWHQIAPERLSDCLVLLVLPREASDAELLAPAQWLLQHFTGRAWIAVELLREASDALWLQRLQQLSEDTALPLVAAGDVHFHVRSRKALQDVMTATRLGRTVAECGFDLQPNYERHLRTRQRIAQLLPKALMAETLRVASCCTFELTDISYQYPSEVVPPGRSAMQHLRELTQAGARDRWPAGVPPGFQQRIEHELTLIEDLQYEHYFLTVADVVAEARRMKILCQGRGSAANSVVCYCLHITSVDPAESTLLFERFISKERNEPPDIDVDFEHDRREDVIQYLYRKYGRSRAALTAVVICYRPRSAIRDVGKALGFSDEQLEIMRKDHSGWVFDVFPDEHRAALLQRLGPLGLSEDDRRLLQLITLARQLNGLPRHLSQHVGGFVLTEGPLERLVPIENATMPNRSVIEWDKDDIDELKMMKVDVLALGMLSALRRCFELVNGLRGKRYDLATIPQQCEATYDMICAADTVGVFQIESRAQMSMLPRLRPRCYYDLVIEVAIVRPGPIEGGMVHPYLKNRALTENQVPYPSEALKEALWRTRGVPIFQEQVMQVAMIAAGFSAGEADQLRRAMAAWKRPGVLEKYYDKVVKGMRERGYTDDFAQQIFAQIKGFSSYGFPESHAASFALLTYVSCWFKHHEPAAFLCALLNSQPLGFYSPSQLVQDARRHDVDVRAIDVNHSDHDSTLELLPGRQQPAVRLGLRLVSGLGEAAARRIEAARQQATFSHPQDLAHRARLTQADMQHLAAADALTSLAGHRRQQVWQASALHAVPQLLQGSLLPEDDLPLPEAAESEEVLWDYAATGLTLRRHPLALLRPRLTRDGWLNAAQLKNHRTGSKARACGIVTGRQKPQTAKGTLFITLEDETGNVAVIVWPDIYTKHRDVILGARLLAVEGVWQRGDGDVRHLLARGFENLNRLLGRLPTESRDFR
ncbi:error-prone DNA polymerase [Roseateles sp. DC23W]|uniref:Error-prone DNA polymerase n=1 Tax=Pelomonas dachongensis TaxID=3299029 RepID=A0ABW7EKE4_9BURK